MKNLRESFNRILADIKKYGMAAVIFLIYYVIVHLTRSAFCPMVYITGLPCAGCGMTRAFLFMLRGEFQRAAFIHPMSYLLLGTAAYCIYFRYIKGTKIKGFKILAWGLIITMLSFYAVRMYLYFPDRVPYTYASDNLLANRFFWYKDMINDLILKLRSLRNN